jgi:hypothetical protein
MRNRPPTTDHKGPPWRAALSSVLCLLTSDIHIGVNFLPNLSLYPGEVAKLLVKRMFLIDTWPVEAGFAGKIRKHRPRG